MEATQQSINIKASVWTVAVHVVLLLLFFFIKYNTITEQPLQELGMEVNLGTDADGSGTDQPMITEDPAPDNREANNVTVATPQETNTEKEVLKTEEPDAPVINTKPAETKKPVRNTVVAEKQKQTTKTNTQTTQPAQPKPQQPRYVYNGGIGRGGNSAATNKPGTGEGNTTGSGDRGVPGGTPGASNYTGTPGRGGISHTIRGRSIIAFPPPEADYKEGGKVVIRVTVNKDGEIVGKQVKSFSNAEIKNIALRKLDKVKFSKRTDSDEEQFGDITFVFKTRS